MSMLWVILFLVPAFAAELEIDANYDHNQHPNEASGSGDPQKINIDIELENIFHISPDGSVHARVKVTESWTEHRLRVKGGSLAQRVQIDAAIWTPNGKFKNLENIKSVSVTNYLHANANGDDTIVHITEMTVYIGCNFDYTWVPFDWQDCEFIYYDNFNAAFYMEFVPGKFTIGDDIEIAQWEIVHDDYERDELKEYGGTTVPAVKATITLDRQISQFMQFHFLPTICLVLLSYASFFIDFKAVPARVTLGIIPILTAFHGAGYVLQNIPKFSHSAWIVEFLFVSLLFNIGAMIEYVVVIYMDKNYEQHREIMKRKQTEALLTSRVSPEKIEQPMVTNNATETSAIADEEVPQNKCRK